MNKNQDFTNISEMLKAWNLTQLLQHFHDEDIGIEELKMMKIHHMTELLQKYSLGVRIQFEYNFEKWRRKHNIPLGGSSSLSYIVNNSSQQMNNVVAEKSNSKTSGTNTIISLAPHSTAQPQGTPDFFKEMLDLMNRTTWSTAPITEQIQAVVKQSPIKNCAIDLDVVENLPPLHPIQPIQPIQQSKPIIIENRVPPPQLPQLSYRGNESPSPPLIPVETTLLSPTDRSLKKYRNLEGATPSLLTIIKSSGVKGASILKYYDKNKQLTATHRTLLIHLIVNYFDIYDYHLSLKMSYNLERQIVKLFPGEQLYNYRTEKRGKIYVKFCNMKRYKRERPNGGRKKPQIYGRDVICVSGSNDDPEIMNEVTGGGVDEDDLTIYPNDDKWNDDQQDDLMHDVRIKTENLDEDGY